LAGFALHITSPVIAVNGKVSWDKESAQDAHSKEMRHRLGDEQVWAGTPCRAPEAHDPKRLQVA